MSDSMDWQPTPSSLTSDIRCGYVKRSALKIVDSLSDHDRRRLAAMAVTCFDSPWNDRLRDLLRGVSCLLGREGRG